MGDSRPTSYVVIHNAELGTKGKNRAYFLGVLQRNIRRALAGLPLGRMQTNAGRIHLSIHAAAEDEVMAEVCRRLAQVLGIAFFAVARVIPGRPLDRLEREAPAHVRDVSRGRDGIRTFCVRTNRADKSFQPESPEINRRIGAAVAAVSGLEVQIRDPDIVLFVEVLPDRILYYCDRIEGQRGLPVGASGKVLSLLSSGIDSPVASRRMMARGCRVIYLHFHSAPYTQRASQDLARDLVRKLGSYQPRSDLYFVPFADVQRKIAVEAPSSIRVVLYRRYMIRLAEVVAGKVRARALVTGDSIGQVASQTVENISVIDDAATLPILRPLVGMSKEEIILEARRFGTYEISIQPYEDCCGYLMPQNPETHAPLEAVRRAEEGLGPMEELLAETIDRAQRLRFRGTEDWIRPSKRSPAPGPDGEDSDLSGVGSKWG